MQLKHAKIPPLPLKQLPHCVRIHSLCILFIEFVEFLGIRICIFVSLEFHCNSAGCAKCHEVIRLKIKDCISEIIDWNYKLAERKNFFVAEPQGGLHKFMKV